MARVHAQGADAIAAFLDHDGGIAGGADQGADTVEVAGPVGPGAGRIAARGGEAEGDDEMGRIVSLDAGRSEEHTSELQSLMRISSAVFCLTKKKSHIT